MNDIFKIFKKRCAQGKGTNITDVIKDLNENEQNEIMNGGGSRFDRANKSYLSISKSGRLKSKKSQNQARILNDELFNPANLNITNNNANSNNMSNDAKNRPIYDQFSDNADSSQTSSTNSSFRSSLEDLLQQQHQQQNINYNLMNYNSNNNYLINSNKHNSNYYNNANYSTKY